MIDLAPGECRDVDPDRVLVPARLALVTRAALRASRSRTVASLVRWIEQGTPPAPARDRAVRALCWASHLALEPDPPGLDRLCDPLRVIARGRGDCFDLAGALLSVEYALGYRAHLLHLAVPDAPEDHVVVELLTRDAWILLDPTLRECVPDRTRPSRWWRGYQGG